MTRGDPPDGGFWMLDPGLVHLNHGSYGALPRVVAAEQDRWRDELEADPTGFFTDTYWDALETARQRLAGFVGADPAGSVFVDNATTGVSTVLRSWEHRISAGDELLVTDHAYNACRNALDALAARRRARVVVAPVPFPVTDPAAMVNAVVSRAGSHTRLALIDHVTSATALVLPIAEIVAALEPDVPVLVDAAHAPGMVPLRLDGLGASFVTGNAHKWLGAPKGAAFLWARSDRRDGLEPLVLSHGWNGRARATPIANRLHELFDWTGTRDPSAVLSLPVALDALGGLLPGGWSELMATNRALALEARRLLVERLDLQAPCPESMIGSMAALALPRAAPGDAERLRRRLRDTHRIVVPVSEWPAPGDRLVRVSAQHYNRLDQYELLADALAPYATLGA